MNKTFVIDSVEEISKFQFDVRRGYISIDTEFRKFGRKDHNFHLSLIQICYCNSQSRKNVLIIDYYTIKKQLKNDALMIDPLLLRGRLNSVFKNFRELLLNTSITKVFHSCYQDFEFLLYELDVEIENIFDVQVADLFLGSKHSLSYEKIIYKYFKIEICKKIDYRNWLNRPLPQEYLQYAIIDVTLLYDLYPIIKKFLISTNKISWADEEMTNIRKKCVAVLEIDVIAKCFHHKFAVRNAREADLIREILLWRRNTAYNACMNDKTILDCQSIYEIAKVLLTLGAAEKHGENCLKNEDNTSSWQATLNIELATERLESYFKNRDLLINFLLFYENYCEQLHEQKQTTQQNKEQSCQIDSDEQIDDKLDVLSLSPESERDEIALSILKLGLQILAKKHSISSELLFNQHDINYFLVDKKSCRLKHGWRAAICNQSLCDLLSNKAALSINDIIPLKND